MSNGTITKLTSATVALGATVTQPTLDLLTAMGHGNGSGATEEFVTVPGRSNTSNAANFSGNTDEDKITAAIASGKPYCFIPKSMQPYDPTAVTFDNAVHMICEGGNPSVDEWDVVAYGAALDRTTDDTAAVKAVVAAASAQSATGMPRAIRFRGVAKTTEPILVSASGIRLLGPGTGYGTTRLIGGGYALGGIQASGFHGPVLYVEGGASPADLTTSLVAGSGQAWNAGTHSSTSWWSLSELGSMDLNGLSAFTVEMFYKGTGTDNAFITSQGRLYSSGTQARCFTLRTQPAGVGLTCSITLSGGIVSATGGTINDGSVHHLAGAYDGTTLRIFVDGTQVASAAGSGTLVQKPWEIVTLGASVNQFPEQDFWDSGAGTMDSPRISNAALYTANFAAPTQKLPALSSTLALMWFDEFKGLLGKVYVGTSGRGWARYRAASSSGIIYGFILDGFSILGSINNDGVVLGEDVEFWSMRNCLFDLVRRGVYAPHGNHFQWRMENCFFNQPRWMCVGFGANTGIGQMDTVWTFGGKLPYVFATAGNVTLNNVYAVCSGTGVNANYGAFLFNNQNTSSGVPVLNGCKVDAETGLNATIWQAGLIFGGRGLNTDGIQCNGCQFETQNGAPWLIGDNIQSGSFRECGFFAIGASPSSVMTTAGTFKRPVKFDNCHQAGTWTPWSDVAGTAEVASIGKGIAVAYSAAPTFDCSLRDEFEITLTGDCAPAITKVTPGQSILVTIIQDGIGGHAFTPPANLKGCGTISSAPDSVNQQRFTAMLDSATNPTLMADAAMVSV